MFNLCSKYQLYIYTTSQLYRPPTFPTHHTASPAISLFLALGRVALPTCTSIYFTYMYILLFTRVNKHYTCHLHVHTLLTAFSYTNKYVTFELMEYSPAAVQMVKKTSRNHITILYTSIRQMAERIRQKCEYLKKMVELIIGNSDDELGIGLCRNSHHFR